jgi:hypothetical protein
MYLHIVNYGQFMNSQLAGAETISNDRCVIEVFFFSSFWWKECKFSPVQSFRDYLVSRIKTLVK